MHKYFILFIAFILSSCSMVEKKPTNQPQKLNTGDESLIETIPLLKPAAQQMFDQAKIKLENQEIESAISYLTKANQIQPKAPQVTQKLAEIYLRKGEYQKSFQWARISAINGPSKGKVCEKSWTILALSAEQLGEFPTLENALERSSQCISKAPKRY